MESQANLYEGFKDPQYMRVSVNKNGKFLSPQRSQKVRNHSPDGFSWGYGGSGPAQLALAILLEEYDEKTALYYYQDFKWEVIANLPQSCNWSLDSQTIAKIMKRMIEAEELHLEAEREDDHEEVQR